MTKFAGLSGGTALGVGAAAVVAIVGAGLYFAGAFTPSAKVSPAPAALTEPAATVPEATTETAMAEPVGGPDEPPAEEIAIRPDPPSIDTFRLDADGRMLISGRAAPGWRVDVLLDGVSLTVLTADGGGQFADFLDVAPSDQTRVLSLAMVAPEGGAPIASADQIIIAPTPPRVVAGAETPETSETPVEDVLPDLTESTWRDPEDTAIVATPEPAEPEGAEIAATPGPVEEQLAPAEPADERLAAAEAVAESADPTVLKADETGVTVLQAPDPVGLAPEVMSIVALDAITYNEDGQVQLSGRGRGEGFVRVYLDNKPITTSRIAAGGNWRSDLPQVDTGVYTLRIDEVDTAGQVTSRVETPFKREDDGVLAEAGALGSGKQAQVVTVQPGSTLWAISREAYGQGILYVRVFAANSDRIRDPDLIYPGQVFTLPE